ncbi:MAG: FAD binding domain-containing protein [Burkholderiales bacterium]|nr:FAD binding domain-containing protein [Burkholderiales bacterium]
MILFDFELERPDTAADAVAMLARLRGDARLLAGGTDLVPNMRAELVRPGVLVSLAAVAPAAPETLSDGRLRVDALSRLADLERSSAVCAHAPMLAESARAVGGNQVREMGTLGGNLCQESRCLYYNQRHDYQFAAPCYKLGGERCYPFPTNKRDTCWSVHMSDVAPALVALGAELEVLGEAGPRRIPAEELFSGNGLAPIALDAAELIRAVIVPAPAPRSGWGFHKSTVRGGLEFGMAVMAVMLALADDGKTCASARVAIGAVRERPVRAPAAERLLAGAALDDARLAEAAAAAAKEVNPLPHHGFTRRYLMDNIRVHLRRTLALALDRARGARA